MTPVPLAVGRSRIRQQPGIRVTAETLGSRDVHVVDGLPVTSLIWALAWELRHASSVRRAVGIADMAAYPWIVPHEAQGMTLEEFPHLKRWFEGIRARTATQRAYAVGETIKEQTDLRTDEEARKILFGQK